MAARGVGLDPLQLVLEELAPAALRLRLALEERLLLLEPLLVVALVRIADAVVELEDPVRHVREEVAVVRDDDQRALEVLEVRLKAERRLGVEMVRRLVEEQHVGVRQQQAADRHAAAFAAREHLHGRVAGRAPHVRHRAVHEVVDVPVVLRVDDLLELLHLGGGLRIVKLAAEVLVALHHRLRVRHALADDLRHRLRVIKLRLLRQIADLRALRHLHRAHQLGVEPGEDSSVDLPAPLPPITPMCAP